MIGAGVIGLSCAWRAAERGLRVTVLDREHPGSGASGVAAGMVAPLGEATWGEEAGLGFAIDSAASWPGFAEELTEASGLDVAFRRRGALHLALDRDEAEELRRRHELQRSLGLAADWLRPSECRAIQPGISPSAGPGVSALDDGEVDPSRVIEALLAALANAGANILNGVEVCGLLGDERLVSGVRTTDGREFPGGSVLLATGAWSGSLDWLPATAQLPVRPVKGQILTLQGPAADPVCERLIVTERVYLVPRPDGRLLIGATVEDRGFDTSVTAGGVYELLREAYRVFPEVSELELIATRAGLRPASPDNLPLIGSAGPDGLLVATGHWRNGVMLSPATAEAIAGLVAGEQPSADLSAFDPRRFTGVADRDREAVQR